MADSRDADSTVRVRRRVRRLKADPAALFFFFALILAVSNLFLGCVSKTALPEFNMPLSQIRALVVGQLPGGLAQESQNGRELRSKYFKVTRVDLFEVIDESEINKKTPVAERAYSEVLILGDRRPYRVDTRVIREKWHRPLKKYVVLGLDKELTRKFADRIREALANRREDRNVIDDFRAF